MPATFSAAIRHSYSAASSPWWVATRVNASGGARGVGIATTQSVVASSILILVADYFLTAVMFSEVVVKDSIAPLKVGIVVIWRQWHWSIC